MTDRTAEIEARLAELRLLLDGASAAPWAWLDGGGETNDELQDGRGEMVATGFRDDINLDGPGPGTTTDGRLSAALRNIAPDLLDDNARLRAALVGLLAANPLGRHQTDESSEWAWNELRGDLQDAWNVAVEQARAALPDTGLNVELLALALGEVVWSPDRGVFAKSLAAEYARTESDLQPPAAG